MNDSLVESDFGLLTALSLCKPDTLRAVDYRTIEERTRIGRIQLSEQSAIAGFGMDLDTDLLRGIQADANEKSLCNRVAANWSSLMVAAKVPVDNLKTLGSELLDTYTKKNVPKDFAWINNVKRVSDSILIDQLNTVVDNRISAGNLEGIRLALPEVRSDRTIFGAKMINDDGPDFSSDLAVYLEARKRDRYQSHLSAMKSHRIKLYDASGILVDSIAIYKCLVIEIEINSNKYLLADGDWFELDKDFVRQVDNFVGGFKSIRHNLPVWNTGEWESAWNKRATKKCSNVALLDSKLIYYGGGSSSIEAADLITTDKVLWHVKRRDKSSSGLSHLFAQGLVSATCLMDQSFRVEVAKYLPSSHSSIANELRTSTFSPREWKIAYVILGAPKTSPAKSIPFFSKVNMRKQVMQLRAMSFDVRIVGI